jgi:hypothetical protein
VIQTGSVNAHLKWFFTLNRHKSTQIQHGTLPCQVSRVKSRSTGVNSPSKGINESCLSLLYYVSAVSIVGAHVKFFKVLDANEVLFRNVKRLGYQPIFKIKLHTYKRFISWICVHRQHVFQGARPSSQMKGASSHMKSYFERCKFSNEILFHNVKLVGYQSIIEKKTHARTHARVLFREICWQLQQGGYYYILICVFWYWAYVACFC